MNTRNEFSGLSQSELDILLSEYLYDSAREKKPLDEKKIEELLQAGANPNYKNEEGETLLLEAIRRCNDALVVLLIKFGANVNHHSISRCSIIPTAKEELFQWAAENEKTMLQIARAEYYGARRFERQEDKVKALKCYDLVASKFVIPSEYIVTQAELEQLYKNIYQKIRDEIQQANNKPILVVLGEAHLSLVSLLIEIFTFLICKQFNFNLYLAEANRQIFEMLKRGERIPGSFADWKTIYDNLPFALQTGYEAIPVDLGVFGARRVGKTYDEYEEIEPEKAILNGTTEKGMIYRDCVMHDVISDGINQNAILIVGSSHLMGLQNKKFSNHHTVYINATDYIPSQTRMLIEIIEKKYYKRATEFLLSSPSVYQPKNQCLSGVEYFWHPELVIATANKIHETLTKTLDTKIVPLSSKWLFTIEKEEKSEISQQTNKANYTCTLL